MQLFLENRYSESSQYLFNSVSKDIISYLIFILNFDSINSIISLTALNDLDLFIYCFLESI